MNGTSKSILAWLGTSLVAVVAAVGSIFRQHDLTIVELREKLDMLTRRLDMAEQDMRSNRLTKMAPETKIAIAALRKELNSIEIRLGLLENQISIPKGRK